MLSTLYRFKRLIAFVLVSAFCVTNTSMAVFAAEITKYDKLPTNTVIEKDAAKAIWNIKTTTTAKNGTIGVNTFSKFNVDKGDVVNLRLINSQNKLVNLIFDSSASQINGIVNSYKGGQIGGNVLFANPHGFVIGKDGVFNVGSLTLMTPKEDVMKKIFDGNTPSDANVDKLITFKFGKDNYYVGTTDDGKSKLEMVPAKINIDGKINSAGGIDIINGGRDISIGKDAELNANMSFTSDENGENVVASVGTAPSVSSTFSTAMNDGKGINIISQNLSYTSDYLGAIVNIEGKVHANGGDVIVQTETNSLDKESYTGTEEDTTVSLINIKSGADIQGHDVNFRALAYAENGDHDITGLTGGKMETYLQLFDLQEYVNMLLSNFFHIGKLQTKVTIDDGAKVSALNDVNLLSRTDLPLGATTLCITASFNLVLLDILTESRIKSGAEITAQNNLTVQSITDAVINISTKSSNMPGVIEDIIDANSDPLDVNEEIKKKFDKGSYALTVADINIDNKAIIEKDVILNVNNNINVSANMLRDIVSVTKNGFIPVFDKNRGMLGIAVAVVIGDSTNEAIMNADADINGSLIVNADYTGKLTSTVAGSSGSPGEDGDFGMGGKVVFNIVKFVTQGFAFEKWGNLLDKGFEKIGGNSKDRVDATFGKIHIAGAVNTAVDNVENNAYIGLKDAENDIKPTINAKNVVVGSTLTDHKSHVSAKSSASNGETVVAGAFAINVKSLDADAKVYGDLTLDGDANKGALIIGSETKVERPSMLDDLWSFFDIMSYHGFYKKTQKEDVGNVNSTNVNKYLENIGITSEKQEEIDQTHKVSNLLKPFNYISSNLGSENFFQTFAQSSASAKSKDKDTNAWAGAFSVMTSSVHSNAELAGGSVVTLKGANSDNNGVIISSTTDSTLWTAATLMDIFTIKDIKDGNIIPGGKARDGNATGGSISVLVNDVNTTATIGKDAEIKTAGDGVAGNVSVIAKEEGQFINITAGTSAADKSGIAGNIAISITPACETKASIEEGANIEAKDVTVDASKDDNWYSAIFSFANSSKSVAFGIGTMFIFDTVEAYIKGNVVASGDVIVNALYDKLFMNVSVNIGVAKSQEEENEFDPQDLIIDDIENDDDDDNGSVANAILGFINGLNDEDAIDLNQSFNLGDADDIIGQARNVGGGNVGRVDKNTYAGAGALLLNVASDNIKAYISDGAKVQAGEDVKVTGESIDKNIEVGAIGSFNGKIGGGATVGFNLNNNTVESYIGNAIVDAKNNTEVSANEDSIIYSFSAGVVQARDKSGVGILSLDIQKNNISASVRDGAKINTSEGYDVENQSVKIDAKIDNDVIKGVGALAIAKYDNAGGAAVDTDAAKSTVNAYIKDAEVNASKDIKVSAKSDTKLIDITAAGAVSKYDSSYSGTVGLYVATGEVNAYMDNTKINKYKYTAGGEQQARENKGADIKVSAEDIYDNITVAGNVTVGKSSTAGGAIRIDIISDKVNAYIKDSDIDTTGDLSITNNSKIDNIAVTAAGVGSKEESAFGGAIALIVNDMDQTSYIDNSTVLSKSVTMDSDTNFKSIDVAGGITVATQGTAIGGSIYVAVADNDIYNYVKNSNITATNDISLTTDNIINSIAVILGGSGGQGLAVSGAISTIVNNSESNTYIQSENGNAKKNISSTDGKIALIGTDNINIRNTTGNVSIATDQVGAGASINTVVDNSNLESKVDGVVLSSKTGVEVDAHATNDVLAITVGGAGGSGAALQGSINTVVMSGDVTSKIVDSVISTEGFVKVDSFDKTFIRGGTGAIAISISAGALGGTIVTGVINNAVVAAIENSRVDATGKVTVSSLAKESIGTESTPFFTIAGGGASTLGIEGVVDTMVINSTSDAHIRGTKTVTENNENKQYGIKSKDDVEVNSEGNAVLHTAGGAAAGGITAGVGATVHTVVIDKDTLSQSSDTIVEAKNISSVAKEVDDFFTTLIAAGGGGTAGIAGVVNTNVITSDVKTGFKNSTLKATEKIDINSNAQANMQTITGSGAGGGTAGIGLSAVNDVIRYRLEAAADNVTATFNSLNVDAQTDNTYKFSTVSGAGGGLAGVVGVENVNYINNEVKAFATGNLTGNNATVNAKDKVTFKDSYSGVAGGGGTAGVGAAVEVNQVTSTVLAYVGGDAVKVNNINVKADGEQNFNHIVVVGLAGGGMGAGAGTALANLIETTVKAYVTEGSNIGASDNYANSISLNATNTINLTEDLGALALGLGGAGIGATVGVNKIKNTVEAYTGKNTKVYTKDMAIKAQSNNNLGNSETGGSLIAVAGAGGLYFGGAGTVIYNSVKDTVNAYVGKTNKIYLLTGGKLDVEATDITKIYDSTGAVAGGAGGLGASVDYNLIENTVVACVKPDSEITGSADISVVADSQEVINNLAVIVSGGIGSLTGGVLYASIGKKVGNASYNELSEKDQENFKAGEKQSKEVTDKAEEKTTGANRSFNDAFNKALDKVTENRNTNGSKARSIAKRQETDSLFTKSEHSGVTESDTDRNGTTSAFIDSNVKIDANNLTVNAKNRDNVELRTTGVAAGGVAIGVSIAISDDTTTTNAFIQNDANINVNSLTLKAESTDDQHIKTLGVAVGAGGGSGSSAHIKSNKTTNAYINQAAKITTLGDMLITAISKSGTEKLYAEALGHAYGGVAVGVSVAHATSKGDTKIDIGEGVTLISTNGNITIKTDADEYAHSDAWAAVGALAGGSGAESEATVGKNTTVNIQKDFSATAENGNLDITSNAKNNAFAESNGRAYGVVSAGGTKTIAKIDHTSGVKIADATTSKVIKAKEVAILSLADNKTKSTTYAGAGAAVGCAGSEVDSIIESKNNSYIGKNYEIDTDKYSSRTGTKNDYLSYNKSNSFGVVTLAIPLIRNTINSTVKNESYADINSDSSIMIASGNEVVKAGVNGYDIYGGSGGLATGSGGSIKDNVTMTTKTIFGGDRAVALGDFGNGAIDISALNTATINEKADLYSHGGIAGADMDSIVQLTADADVVVSNKNIRTKDDHISYAARNDADIYAKSNVESYGGVAGAGGQASAIASRLSASVTFEKDTHSTSGRDTNISAVSNKSLESYIYTRTRGLVSVLNDSSNAKSQDSRAYVYINGNGDDNETSGNAVITAFDAINITAMNTASKIRADRDSKAYQLWCIPYTGKGNKNTQNTVAGSILHNGILKSGLGYNKSLHLNINGEQIDEDGNVVENGTYGIYASKEKIGTIKTNDMQEDIEAYNRTKTNITDAFEDFEREVEEEIDGYETIIRNNTTQKNSLITENAEKTTAMNTAKTNKQTAETNKTNLTNANNDLSKLDGSANDIQEFEDAYGSLGNEYINNLISTIKAYHAADDAHKTEAYNAYIAAKSNWATYYPVASESLENDISTYASDIARLTSEIEQNGFKIEDCQNAIDSNNAKITTAEADLETMRVKKEADVARIDAKIEELQAKIDAGVDIDVYAFYVDDVIIRSGKITFNGDSAYITHVAGNGYIHAPGQNATIKIINDSVSNMTFQKLVIGSNLQGGVTANNATIDSTIHFDTMSDEPSKISVLNSVDKNDPTVNVDTESNAGDMVFYGNIENPNGIIEITNYTGDVVVNSGITARDLHIRVPNGGYEQTYTNNTSKIGGESGAGAIVAAGNISISSQTIDINGLIKSGTEIKEAYIPNLTIKKVGDKYYQVVDGVESLLTESSTTKGYYYLNLYDDNSDVAVLKQIKAYFKPADLEATGDNIAGDIYLFKADTVGGNITLTGNIINTSNSGGRIELVNGYGRINVVNDSSYNLVTSSLNADTETKGVLTINDFKVGTKSDSTTPDYSDFNNIKQSDLAEEFLKTHAGKYTVQIDDNGEIQTTAENVTSGNGYWYPIYSYNDSEDGLRTCTTYYKPGNDAYYVTRAGEMVEYQRYVERSWIVELFCGKKYVTDYYYRSPEYGIAQNSITVQFQGYTSPKINITSKGNVVMNNSISCLPGTVNITSDGNITSNSLSYSVSGKNINLISGGNGLSGTIGEYDAEYSTVKPMQVIIYDNGVLTAKGKDVYLNYPKTGVSNINLVANGGTLYLATDSGSIDMTGKSLFGIQADTLELHADTINLNPADLEHGADYLINVHSWIARAKDDIYIENKGDIVAKYIVSENNGNITLSSKIGSILAGDTDTYSEYNIHGGSYNIIARSGSVGTSDKPLTFSGAGIYNVVADSDVNIKSNSKMYIDCITSINGSVELNAKFGIIASDITTDKLGWTFKYDSQGNPVYEDGTLVLDENMRVYNISSKENLRFVTTRGNIENLTVDTDGVISAFAGYDDVEADGYVDFDKIADATSDINITLLSKPLPVKADANNSNSTDDIDDIEELTNRKDMLVNRIVAAQNVTLSSERAVLRANDGLIVGEDITINAVGDIGGTSNDTALCFGSKGTVSVYTKAGSNVRIFNVSNLKINRIDVTNNIVKQDAYANNANAINDITIDSLGRIVNAINDKEIVEKTTKATITGTEEQDDVSPDQTPVITREIDVNGQDYADKEQTKPNLRAANIHISSALGKIGEYDKDLVVETTSQNGGLSYNAIGLVEKGDAYIKGIGDTLYIKDGASNDVRITTKSTNIVANNIKAYGDAMLYSEEGNITAFNIVADTTSHDNILTISTGGNATLTDAKANDILVSSSKDTTVSGNIETENISIFANNHATIQNAKVDYLVDNADKTKDIVTIYSFGDATINNATIKGIASVITEDILNISEVPNNIYVYNSTVKDNMYIASSDDTVISTLTVDGNLDNVSKNTTVNGKLAVAENAEIVAENNVVINEIDAGSIKIDSANADITKLSTTADAGNNISGNVEINTSNDTKIGSGTVGGKFTNKSGKVTVDETTGETTVTDGNTTITGTLTVTGDADITSTKDISVTGKIIADNLNINSKNATIADFESQKDTVINTSSDTTIANGTVGAKFTNTSENTTVTGILTITGDADIDSTNNVTINEISSDNLNIDSKNTDVTKLTSVKDTVINTVNDTKIKDGTVGGKFTNISGKVTVDETTGETTVTDGSTTITGTLTVTGGADIDSTKDVTVSGALNVDKDANITAVNNIKIADGHIKQNMNLDAKSVKIDEIKIDELITAHTNTADINTSYDLNINVIDGKDNTHSDSVKIVSAQNITNGVGGNAPNILVKNVDLTAGESIAAKDNKLNIDLTKDNSIAVEAGNGINVNTTGAKANYTKIKGKEANIIADGDVKIRNMNVDNLELKTKSTQVDVSGKVNKRGNIRTQDKRIGINNENLEPDFSATVQVHTAGKPFHLKTNGSNDVEIRSLFVVRHNQGIVINGTDFLSSMESEAIKSAEVSLKNSDRRNRNIFHTEDYLKGDSPLSDNLELIKTIHGEIITPANAFDVINNGNNISENLIKKTKKKANASIYDKISYLK